MYLKSLKIQGFKSFADKIELDFSSGVTAIVGPNGSGKSNINDAVKWVLGEQSAKSLRGSKMEDVIFNGTQKRNPMGFAEVTLVLDNKQRMFNIDFDEVVITRKVFSSGESQYLINKTPCRLKDIHETFMDTGLGRDGYSMVGQGKIDEILSNKSEDRRDIFEEAAGISKYRYRKEEAERKLAHTEDNLSRIYDIITELEGQLEPLLKQSEKAKKYLVLKEELKKYEVNVAVHIIDNNKKQITELENKLKIASDDLEREKQSLETAEKNQEIYYNKARTQEENVRITEQKNRDYQAKISMLKSEIEVLHNTINGNLKLIERINTETKELSGRELSLKKEMENCEKLFAEHNKTVADIDKDIKALNEQIDLIKLEADKHTAEIDEKKNVVVSTLTAISNYRLRISNLEIMKNNLIERKRSVAEEMQEKTDADAEYKLDEFIRQKNQKDLFLAKLDADYNALLKRKNEAASVLEEDKKGLINVNIELNEKKSKVHILKAIEENLDGYSRSVKEILNSHKTGSLSDCKIYGPVSKLIEFEPQYSTAIEAALLGAIQNIVVESEQDAKTAIEYLKNNRLGRATFMPVSAVKGNIFDVRDIQNDTGFISVLSEKIKVDSKFRAIINNLLGRVILADTIDNGIKMSRKHKNSFRIVTLDGSVFNAGGSMSGGSINKNASLLSKKAEIVRLEEQIISLQTKYQKLSGEIKLSDEEIKKLDSQLLEASLVITENKEILAALQKDIAYHNSIISRSADLKQKLENEQNQINKSISDNEKEKSEIELKIEEMQKLSGQQKNDVDTLEEVYEAYLNKQDNISKGIIEKDILKSSALKDIEITRNRIEGLRLELSQYSASKDLKGLEIGDIEKKNNDYKAEIDEKEKAVQELLTASNDFDSDVLKMLEEKKEYDKKSLELQQKSKELRDTVYELSNEYSRVENKKVKLDTELENVINKIWDEYELTYSDALNYKTDIDNITDANKSIAELKGKIRALGNVNVDSIEEYKAVRERFEFLSTQRDDLVKAKSDLNSIINQMITVMKKQFAEEFKKISVYFKSTFTELFGGGNASLSLEDESNILECGINIDVQPPGKKLQGLSLLSGGERALSAIALLFAILKTRPTPFCFLDEIEAALDDVNVYRFADYIKNYSESTQFIIVTHRRGTMESADVIYGVTMQEKGVSKLIKLNLNEISEIQ